MQSIVHPQAFTHTKRLQRMLRGSESCYQLLIAALEGAGATTPPQLSGGSDAVALADLQAVNAAVALQRTLEDESKPCVEALVLPANSIHKGHSTDEMAEPSICVADSRATSVSLEASGTRPDAMAPVEDGTYLGKRRRS
jgi:hypothetical protein